MIGKIIEGRYVGSEVHKHPERNVLYIQTQEGQKVALSKNNIISMDDVSSQYPLVGSKTMMVMWNDFEISILQFGNVTNNAVKEHVQKKDMHTPEDNSSTYKNTEKDHRNREAWKEFERQRKTKKNGKTHGLIFLGTILIVAICFVFAIATRETVAKTPVDAMGACLEIMSLPESELTDKKMALFYDNLELLGIDSYSKRDLSNDEVEAIVAEYSFPEFYQFICDLSQFYDAHNRYLVYEDYENIVKQYLRISDVKMYTVAELDLIESDDFYKQYPSEKPQPETTTVSGKFFEDGDDKVETETRENISTVTYIGDFAIEKVSGYNYDEGVYEWRNGEFIDEPASWKKFEKEYLWYKGELITSLEEAITIAKYNGETYVVGHYVGIEKIDDGVSLDFKNRDLAPHYENGERLLAAGEYDKAIEEFTLAGEYWDAEDRVYVAKYEKAETQLRNGFYLDAAGTFADIEGYKDAHDRFIEALYLAAVDYEKQEEYAAAAICYEKVGAYRDAQERKIKCEWLDVQPGSKITLGSYDLDENPENGFEPIQWYVITIQGKEALIVSEFCFGSYSYHGTNEAVTWETCDLRRWLNEDFYNIAFTEEEKRIILPSIKQINGSEVIDYVFIPNKSESEQGLAYTHPEGVDSYIQGMGLSDNPSITSYWLRSDAVRYNRQFSAEASAWRIPVSVTSTMEVLPVLWISLE